MNSKTEIPRKFCTDKLLKELRKIGVKTDGYIYSMEAVLKNNGYMNPAMEQQGDSTYFGFSIDGYIRLYLNYADACAEKIIFIIQNGKIK